MTLTGQTLEDQTVSTTDTATTTTANYPDNEISPEQRERIVASLPSDWSKEEVNNFIETYAIKLAGPVEEEPESLPLSINDGEDTYIEPEMQVVESGLPVSKMSKSGLTLDTYVLLNGRSVPLRALWQAGRLVVQPLRYLFEGSRINPARVVQYEARLTDLPKYYVITEETYKVLNGDKVIGEDEPLTEDQLKDVQATVSIVQADVLDGRTTGKLKTTS